MRELRFDDGMHFPGYIAARSVWDSVSDDETPFLMKEEKGGVVSSA